MKALNEMNKIERAYTLAQLFPEFLKDFISFTQKEIKYFRDNEENIRLDWPSYSLITHDYWYLLIGKVEGLIKQFNVALYRNPIVFSEQLFYEYNWVFMTHCLLRYVESGHASDKFRLAIELLFGNDWVMTIQFNKSEHR